MTTLASLDLEAQGAPPEQIKAIKQQLHVINEDEREEKRHEQEEDEEDEDEEYDYKADEEDRSSTDTVDEQPKELQEVSFDNSQNVFKRQPLDPILDQCETNPDFAVICSFISKFGEFLDLVLNIEQLKSSIENQTTLDDRLVEIHIKLLKKVYRYFVRDLWVKALVRYIASYSYQDAWELEELGYLQTRTSIKLQLLVRLLEAQFEVEPKLKAYISSCDEDKLRLLPLGRDNKGNTYWKQTDKEGNFRIFQEEPLNYRSWKAICTKPEELNYLIEDLDNNKMNLVKGEPMTEPYNPMPEIFPELFKKEENNINIKEEPSSNDNHNNHDNHNNNNNNNNHDGDVDDDDNERTPRKSVNDEDEDTIEEPVIEKRTRTARGRSIIAVYKEPTPPIEEDDPCSYCDKSNDPELILLCDNCDAGYHISCCLPPLMIIPDGDWFCPTCEHKQLLKRLKSFYPNLLRVLKAKEIERAREEKIKLQAEMKRKKQEELELKKKQLEVAKKERSKEQAPAKKRQKTSYDNLNEPIGLDELDEILGVETDEEDEQMSSYSNETEGLDDKSLYSSETEELPERGSSYSSETEEDEDQMSLYSGDTEEEEEEEEEQMSLYSSDGTEAEENFSLASEGSSMDDDQEDKKPKKSKKPKTKKRKKDSSDESYESEDDYQPSRNRRRAAATNICYRASSDEEDELISYARSRVAATTAKGPEQVDDDDEVTGLTVANGVTVKQVAMDRVAMSQGEGTLSMMGLEAVNQVAMSGAAVVGQEVEAGQEAVEQEAVKQDDRDPSSPFHPPFYGADEF